jgi:hypothetical protein
MKDKIFEEIVETNVKNIELKLNSFRENSQSWNPEKRDSERKNIENELKNFNDKFAKYNGQVHLYLKLQSKYIEIIREVYSNIGLEEVAVK